MFHVITLFGGVHATLIVPQQTVDRLAGTCFRGIDVRRAGNFNRFAGARDLFREDAVYNGLRQHASEAARELLAKQKSNGAFSCTIVCKTPVGWESTDDVDKYAEIDLEPFRINSKCVATRIKPERTNLLAPLTNLVTFVCEPQFKGTEWSIFIPTMYPGKDVGDLHGNITNRTKRVFFDWNHPGV